MIKGKINHVIFAGDNGFFVGTFRVSDTDQEALLKYVKKVITITGVLMDANDTEIYVLEGEYIKHERFGYQYKFNSYTKEAPTGRNAVIDFLASPLIKGCGKTTAKLIVDTLGDNAIDLIKENINNLDLVPKLSKAKALKIYESIINNSYNDDLIIELKRLGFSIKEATKIINKFKDKTKTYLEENIYYFKSIIDFDRIDKIYVMNNKEDSLLRKSECTLNTMKKLSDMTGDIYYFKEEVNSALRTMYKIIIDEEEFDSILNALILKGLIKIVDTKYYLMDNYLMEMDIADRLFEINRLPKKNIKDFKSKINNLENMFKVSYNIEQKNAILNALENRISIISGGPGTGKTTIINAITRIYIEAFKLSPIEVATSIALLAPTGRAAKKMSESTGLPASTIHRYLKWNKDTNDFQVNLYNKNYHKLIIVDEVSMIDTYLFDALLKGIGVDVQIVFVGDKDQLPSVGAGLILNDLIASKVFSYSPLHNIYRQSDNSYIPYLAKEIKECNLSRDYLKRKDDYNFFITDTSKISKVIKEICKMSIDKGLTDKDIQILAPMYKGENGIDNLNIMLQDLFNKKSLEKREIKFGDIIYREKDKVLELVNNPDCNIFNGDIGYIYKINTKDKKDIITINFDGNYVEYKRDDLINIKHAYAISIHKSQGSEFKHVIMPISKNYYKMLYNKLVYTGISRAKKSLVLVGEEKAFLMAVNNRYSNDRKTTLKEFLMHKFS